MFHPFGVERGERERERERARSTLLGPLERANLNHWTRNVLFSTYFEFRTIGKVLKPTDSDLNLKFCNVFPPVIFIKLAVIQLLRIT
jgi:hypothetical protein